MFLKSLTLKGFKSFAETTTLEFEPGVTVVVGPNGSGKSNVVDAVAWVLGAQGPRTLRSAKMEDVIFAGTPTRAALGRAEVSLTIDNGAGLLPIELSEVTITRTLFRTGESEYAINRVPCRLLDVQDLLSDTGVGRQQHVIVSQGNLDALLTARPEDRRMIVEEAAGVLKYRRRKERSERRLEATEGSLVRLQDLLREVRRQLRPLEKQAEAARRHDGVVAELTALRRHLAGRELATIDARLAAAVERRGELARAEEEVRSHLAGLDTEVEAGEAQLSSWRDRSDTLDLAEALSRAERLHARAGGSVALLEQRRRGLERELALTADHDIVARLEADGAQLAEQLEAVRAEALGLRPEEESVAGAEAALAAETRALDEGGAGSAPAPSDPAAEVRGELGARRAAVERARGDQRRLDGRVEATRSRRARLDADAALLRRSIQELDGAGPDLAAATQAAAAALARAEEDLAAADDQRREADRVLHRWQARAEALDLALADARARAGLARLGGVDGVLGTLLDLIEVDAGWEAAFEAAADDALAAVVVDGRSTAARALDELRRQDAGGAVVPLPDPVALGSPAPLGAGEGAAPASPLRRHARSSLPAVDALLERLLARAVCAPGWADALDLAAARPDLVVVTPEGDRFSGGVWRVGAGGAGATGAALAEALERAEVSAAEVAAATSRLEEARSVLAEARGAWSDATRAEDTAASERRAAGDALARLDALLADAARDAEAASSQRREAGERLAAELARVGELEERLPALEAEAAVEAERARAERAERSRLADEAEAVGALRRAFEVKAAALEERRSLLSRRLAEVEEGLARHVAEREQAAGRRLRLAGDVQVLQRLGAVAARREADLLGVVERLRAARRAEAEATRAVTDRLDALRRQRAEAEHRLGELRERAGRAELDAAEARVRLEALRETVRRDLDCEPEETRGAPCPSLPPGSSPASRRSELERELRLMGPINPLAVEELGALSERHAFLEAQLEDVRGARRELAKVIRAVDAEIVEVFRAAYADVADNFEKLFATLFPGGQGRLRLTDPENLLETGVEVEARPSGKNVRRLSLLSGGERSLAALAFLFAVFRSRPSPFYLMDEVEAALDDVNLHRFLDLIDEFRAEAQLVIVSHQKRTMEAADCLYGVTMPPGGSSQVVSERVRAATAAG